MSIKVAIGSKIYDISSFSEEQTSDVLELSKSLNYRVNQVISVFGIYDQEMALIIAALSLLEEVKALEEANKRALKLGTSEEPDLFSYNTEEGTEKTEVKQFSKNDVEEIVLSTISSLHEKIKNILVKQ